MMDKERANLGFDDAIDSFDPADWAVGGPTKGRPDSTLARQSAEATGFRSREAKPAAPTAPAPASRAGAPRRRRTGRNAQFNLKARPETIQSFCAVADAQGWGLGETLEHAVALLEREYAAKAS
jgi:hypothetical protein